MKSFLILLLFFSPGSSFGRPKDPSVDEILRRADDNRSPSGEFSFQVEVKDWENENPIRENTYRVYTKRARLALIETLLPERLQGRKLLMRGKDLWLYLPTVKRPTRISFHQRLTGEVSNGDIARTGFVLDYVPRLVGTKTLRRKNYYKLILKSKTKEAPYRHIHLWIEKNNFHPYKAEFYALSGKLLKTAEYLEYEKVFEKMRVTKVIIKDALRPSKQSHLKYKNYRRENLNESFFNKESLS